MLIGKMRARGVPRRAVKHDPGAVVLVAHVEDIARDRAIGRGEARRSPIATIGHDGIVVAANWKPRWFELRRRLWESR